MSVSKAVIEIVDLMLLSASEKEDLSLSIQISTASKHYEDFDEDTLFHVKVQLNSGFDVEGLHSKYVYQEMDIHSGGSLQELSTLLCQMQQKENTSHLCTQSVCEDNNRKVIQKNYKVQIMEGKNDEQTQLTCTESTIKRRKGHKPDSSTLHIRVYQEKTRMMIHSKWLYHYLRLVNFCSPKIQLDLTLKIQENSCLFDIRSPGSVITDNGLQISGSANNYLKESEYQAICPTIQVMCSELITVPDLEIGLPVPVTVSMSAVAFFIRCQYREELKSLATLTVYGPGRIPLLLSCDKDEFNPLYKVDWSSHKLLPLETDDSIVPFEAIPSDFYIRLQDCLRPKSCFVLTVMLFLDLEHGTEEFENDVYLLNWLKSHFVSWFKEQETRCMMVIEDVIQKALIPRYVSNDKVSTCYSQAIPKIASAVYSIVARSCDETFRKKCFEMLQVSHSRAIESEITNRLWEIAETRCGATVPGDLQRSLNRGSAREASLPAAADDEQTVVLHTDSENYDLDRRDTEWCVPVQASQAGCYLPEPSGDLHNDWCLPLEGNDSSTDRCLSGQIRGSYDEEYLPVESYDSDTEWTIPVQRGDIGSMCQSSVLTGNRGTQCPFPPHPDEMDLECLPMQSEDFFGQLSSPGLQSNNMYGIPLDQGTQDRTRAAGFLMGQPEQVISGEAFFSDWTSMKDTELHNFSEKYGSPAFLQHLEEDHISYSQDEMENGINYANSFQETDDKEIADWSHYTY